MWECTYFFDILEKAGAGMSQGPEITHLVSLARMKLLPCVDGYSN